MNRKNKIFAVVMVVLLLICWDFATVKQTAVDKSTFKLESEFDAVTAPTEPVKVAVVPSDYADLANPVSRTTKPSYEQIEGMVRKAIELQGGLDEVIEKGDEVMIKVNLVGGDSPSGQGENTDVNVVKALIKTIYDFQNDVKIIVAEGTARKNDDFTVSGSVWHNSGYVPLLTDPDLDSINLSFLNLNQSISDLVEIDLGAKGTAAPHDFTFHVHKKEVEADVYISVPVLKIHSPGITNALKNQIGTAPGCYYGYDSKSDGREKDGSPTPSKIHPSINRQDWSEEEIVDLSNIAGIDFVVVDAVMCLERSKGFSGDNQLRMNTIVAGYDPVAVDNVCARLFGINPDNIVHIFLAEKVGLGTNDPNYIEVVGASIESTMKKAIKSGRFVGSNRTWILSPAFDGTSISEEYIPNEKDYIPQPLKDGWSEPVFFFDDQNNLHGYYDGKQNIVTYAFTKFYSPLNTEAELWLGRQEPMYVYINGERVYSGESNEDFFGRKEATINIIKGENTLLVKTLNKFGDYTFTVDICEVESDTKYDANRVAGLKYYTDTFTVSYPTTDIYTSPSIDKDGIPLSNYPNPFNDFTTFRFTLTKSEIVTITIRDINGKLIKSINNQYFSAGSHEIEWETENLKSGYYICTLNAGKYSKSIKILLQ